MINQLQLYYKEHFTFQYVRDTEEWHWFQDAEETIFGIHRSVLSNEELDYLLKLFNRYNEERLILRTRTQQKWYDFLFAAKPLQGVDAQHVRLYHIFSKQAIQQIAEFSHAITGVFEQAVLLPISTKHFVLIEINASPLKHLQEVEQIIQALIGDFNVQLSVVVGQLQTLHIGNADKLHNEYQLMDRYRTILTTYRITSFYEVYTYMQHINPIACINVCASNLLESLQDKELTHTIRVFFDSNLNSTVASKKLFIHRNSLQYRLDKLFEETGVDVRSFYQACFVYQMLSEISKI